jgi:hypothetical protein
LKRLGEIRFEGPRRHLVSHVQSEPWLSRRYMVIRESRRASAGDRCLSAGLTRRAAFYRLEMYFYTARGADAKGVP